MAARTSGHASDYRQLFGERPRRVKALGLESHSDDVGSQSAVEFGATGVAADAGRPMPRGERSDLTPQAGGGGGM